MNLMSFRVLSPTAQGSSSLTFPLRVGGLKICRPGTSEGGDRSGEQGSNKRWITERALVLRSFNVVHADPPATAYPPPRSFSPRLLTWVRRLPSLPKPPNLRPQPRRRPDWTSDLGAPAPSTGRSPRLLSITVGMVQGGGADGGRKNSRRAVGDDTERSGAREEGAEGMEGPRRAKDRWGVGDGSTVPA